MSISITACSTYIKPGLQLRLDLSIQRHLFLGNRPQPHLNLRKSIFSASSSQPNGRFEPSSTSKQKTNEPNIPTQETSMESQNRESTSKSSNTQPSCLEDRDTTATMEDGAIKMKINVSGAKSEAIFDNVFSKMVSAAQPIPGFRRVKGGKTPNIRRDVLIQILGQSKVYKQVIKKIINSTVAEYVEKEKLKVTKDLRIEQSLEELEAAFVPGEEFSFDASIRLGEA